MGRPSSYTPEVAAEICRRLAEGESLRAICDAEEMPAASTVIGWALENREGFSEHYTLARQIQAHLYVDEMLDIADDGRNDWMERLDADGQGVGWTQNGEALNRSRQRIDTRKWVASKLLPKIYGDKLALTDPDGGALIVQVVKFADDPSSG
jgi:hypothetical protein